MASRANSALHYLEYTRKDHYYNHELGKLLEIMVHKLRGLRTFFVCSTIARNEDTNDCELASSMVPTHKLGVLRRVLLCSNYNVGTSKGSLLVRVEAVISEILDSRHTPMFSVQDEFHKYLVKIESFEQEMSAWYTSLSDYLQVSDSPVFIDQVKDICDSVLENLDDFLTFHRAYVGIRVDQVDALKENISFFTNFIRFATLLRAENQDIDDLLTLVQPLVIGAAHLAVHLFSANHYNTKVFLVDEKNSTGGLSYDEMKSMVSDLLLRIKPGFTLQGTHKSCSRALECINLSRELYVPTLDLKKFIHFLLSNLWEMLQLDTIPVVSLKDKLQALYEGLRSLRTILIKNPSKFVHSFRNITGATLFDAGVIIFPVYRKDFEIDVGVQDFLDNIKVICTETLELPAVQTSNFNFPKTNLLRFLDFLLDEMTQVKSCDLDSDTRYFLHLVQQDLVYLISLLEVLVESRQQHEDFQALWDFTLEVAYKMEFLIDQLMLGNYLESISASYLSIIEAIRIIKTDSMRMISDKRKVIGVKEVIPAPTDQVPSPYTTLGADEVVGFETEGSSIIDRLERGSKTLQVVAIVGMPGLGKTNLALKVYHDPKIKYHFHVRAWCSISQVFSRRKVLTELLNHIQPGEYSTKNEDDIAQALRRSLLRRRYLIFIDDVWDMQALNCLKESLPDDSTGSRILLTSRLGDLVPEAILDDKPLFLDQLSPEDSLELLQKRLFPGRKDLPPPLHELGKEVAGYCKGLPLTIVIVAGILKTTKQEAWKEILVSLRSGILSTLTNECDNSIELSYQHLPDHLKSCFLSIGAFLEDQVINVKRLLWLWIAEGFVRKIYLKSLEEVAADYLNILISRSLVMRVREGSSGGVQTCRIHDLLRDFCLRKSNEEHFSHVLKRESLPLDELGNLRRLYVHSGAEHFKESQLFCPRLRSLLFFRPTAWKERLDLSFIFRIFKLLRVLSMDQVHLAHIPRDIGLLFQLRYLALQVGEEVSPSIGNLTNLETLILHSKEKVIKLFDSFWNLQKLRHLYLSRKSTAIILPVNNLDGTSLLPELESLSTLYTVNSYLMEMQLRKFINIHRLKCMISGKPGNDIRVISFSFLSQLESLSLSSSTVKFDNETKLIFPASVKKLTFDVLGLSWDIISSITELPNLEVLKLVACIFTGDSWLVKEGRFQKLKVLLLERLRIVNWTAESDDQLSNLEKLVLNNCWQLREIPECLENAATLRMIEIRSCSCHVASLVQKIEECQKDMGNSVLRVHMHDIHEYISENRHTTLGRIVHKEKGISEVNDIYQRVNGQRISASQSDAVSQTDNSEVEDVGDCLPSILAVLVAAGEERCYALSALGGTLFYLKSAFLDESLLRFAKFELLPCSSFGDISQKPYMVLDSAAFENLEIYENSRNGDTVGTLYAQLNRFVTAFGKRLLKKWLARPLYHVKSIQERQDAMAGLKGTNLPFEKSCRSFQTLRGYLLVYLLPVKLWEEMQIRLHYMRMQLQEFISALCGCERISNACSSLAASVLENVDSRLLHHLLTPGINSVAVSISAASVLENVDSRLLHHLLTPGKGLPDVRPVLRIFKDAFDWVEADKSGRIIPKEGVDSEYDDACNDVREVESDLMKQRKVLGDLSINYASVGKDSYLARALGCESSRRV